MQPIICEICGSNDIVKQDGVFVCQHCGTKYSADAVRKMVVDGKVDVSGSTVKVDGSDRLKNLREIAKRAVADNDAEAAVKYYDMILVEEPNNWEAAFYTVYFRAMQCKIAGIQSAAVSVGNCIDTVLKLIRDNVTDPKERRAAYMIVAMRVMSICEMLYTAAHNHYSGIDSSIQSQYVAEYGNRVLAVVNASYTMGNYLNLFFGEEKSAQELAVMAWKAGIERHKSIVRMYSSKEDRVGARDLILEYVAKVQKYDPSYVAPEIDTTSQAMSAIILTIVICIIGFCIIIGVVNG